VYGFESTASSVVDARRNAQVNGISNATFVHGDLTKVAAMMGKQYPNPDVIVTGGLFLQKPLTNLKMRVMREAAFNFCRLAVLLLSA